MKNLLLASIIAGTLAAIGLPGTALADPAISYSGTVAVYEGGIQVGYISNVPNSFGEFVITTDPTAALTVGISAVSSPFSFTATNSPLAGQYVGGITGYSSSSYDLAANNTNYIYIGGTAHTAANAVPTVATNSFTTATSITEAVESTIWSLSGDVLSAQWINTDGSSPATYIVDNNGILLLTGNIAGFADTFGTTTAVTLEVSIAQPTPEPASMALLGAGLAGLAAIRRRRKG